ncbi:HTH-type transcriptional regulator YtlI [Collibacillus ludicampi]|jgi:DNA-binding transcriptional LysR family regulator|uniref:HTH-type transcriptional regulator YtlI n=1 Tax=Collibacillus ludicampi TaxID=2771369 RepID=A0AAV4LFC3_9BACL|nr:LysR family transcriptional regulator [Collibacillus ludicampi]GIM46485.1 HTH-type transcriptional regulator YtlI [Collibacillus ludicampi]
MDIRALKTFQTVVRLGSFQRAAEDLQYAQSTVTMQIQKLESELGVQLFERGKKIRLTEAGRILNRQVTYILNDIEQLRQTMADIQSGETGNIRIGCMEPTASLRLPDILAQYCKARPKVQVTLEIGNTVTITERVYSGDLDIGICTAPDTDFGLNFEPLFVEELALLVPITHPLAKKEEMIAEDLRGERLVLTGRNCAYRRKLEHLLLEKGNSVYPIIQTSSIESIKRLVQVGCGIGIIPRVSVSSPPSGTVLKSVQDLELDVTIGILHRFDEYVSPAMESMIHALRVSLKVSQ